MESSLRSESDDDDEEEYRQIGGKKRDSGRGGSCREGQRGQLSSSVSSNRGQDAASWWEEDKAIMREKSESRWRQEAWDFIRGECFSSRGVNTDTLAIWLRTLLEQNRSLQDTVHRLEKTQGGADVLRRSKTRRLDNDGSQQHIFDSPLLQTVDSLRHEYLDDIQPSPEGRERRVPQIIHEPDSKDDCDAIHRPMLEEVQQQLDSTAAATELRHLRFYAEQVEAENRLLKELVENQKNDIECLLKLSDKARDTGVWDPHGLNFCVVTFEQVFGHTIHTAHNLNKKNNQDLKPVEKMPESVSHPASSYDSRSSLCSELAALEKSPLRTMTKQEYCKVKGLRREIVALQEKCSQRVREGVDKDRTITQLQIEITELNNEMDDLKEENYANLSVINRLKDDLHEAKSQLITSNHVETDLAKHHSMSSLPEMPAYTSKFARNLLRRNSQNVLLQKLTDQLETVNKDKQHLEDERDSLLSRLEAAEAEKFEANQTVQFIRSQMEELATEHEKLKEDFRTLVRRQEDLRPLLLRDCEPGVGISEKSTSVPNIPGLTSLGRSYSQGPAGGKNKDKYQRLNYKQEINNLLSVLGEKQEEVDELSRELERVRDQQEEVDQLSRELERVRDDLNTRDQHLVRIARENELLRDTVEEQNSILQQLQYLGPSPTP